MTSQSVALVEADETAQSTARSRFRERRLFFSAATLLLSKLVSAGTALLSLPLTLSYLGPERYGMWATMSSAIVVFALADLGIGFGLINRVSAAYGKGNTQDIQRVASSAAAMLASIAGALLLLLLAVYSLVPWAAIFNVKTELARAEAGPTAALFIAFWALGIPLSIVQRVQFGMQLGHLANLWQIATSVLALVAIVVATQLNAGVYVLVAALAGTPVLLTLINWVFFFFRQQPDVCPKLALANFSEAVSVVRTGSAFLVLQVAGALAFSSDSLVIAQTLGAEAVADFAVSEKMFSLISLLVMVVSHSLWPAYAEANVRGDAAWIKKTVLRALIFALTSSTALALVLIAFGQDIIHLWIGDKVRPEFGLLLALGVWRVLESVGATNAIYLNASGIIRQQLVMAIGFCITAISLKFYLVTVTGVSGAVWATVIAYCVVVLVPSFRLVFKSLKRFTAG